MGNCHTRSPGLNSDTDYTKEDVPDPSGCVQLNENKNIQTRNFHVNGPRNSSCGAFVGSEIYRAAHEHTSHYPCGEDPGCCASEDGCGIMFLPQLSSYTPPFDRRSKSSVRQANMAVSYLQGSGNCSASQLGYRPGSSLSTDSHHLVDKRGVTSNSSQIGIDSKMSSSSASQLLKYNTNQQLNTVYPSHLPANYSASAGASVTYSPSGNVIEKCNSPHFPATAHRSSVCIDSDVNKAAKYQQKVMQRHPQLPQKYLIHHSLSNSPRHSSATQLENNSGSAGYSTRKVRNGAKRFVAIFDYQAHSREDLSVRKGDKVVVLDNTDSDWWLVDKPATSYHGYVPAAYLAEEDSVEVFEWYFREMSRKDSERLLLLNGNVRGTFLIRESETTQGALSLSVRDFDQVRGDVVNHYKVKQYGDDGSVCITSKKVLPSLVALVTNYSAHADGLCCRLTKPCPRPPPVLTDLSKRTKDHWEIDRSELVLQEKLGNGQFGEVWKGEWNHTKPVAIKTMRQGTMSKEEFLKEARIMKTLCHPHLVRLYAVVPTEPIFIVTELMSNGSLLHFLRSEAGKALEIKHQVDIMAQIADGMAYLEGKELVHRDLAARNVLVGENNEVKIADFGLARQLDRDAEAYNARQGAKFPIKWTAPEAALLGQFTVKSDVWSYGVVLYEVITYGQVPYPSMANTEILHQVSNGYRMPQPNNCPQSIHAVMLQAWDVEPAHRPTFARLCRFFEDYFANEELLAAAAAAVSNGSAASNTGTQQHFAASIAGANLPLADTLYRSSVQQRRAGYPFMESPARLEMNRFSPTHSILTAPPVHPPLFEVTS